ncbi:MAG: glycosyltransferase family 4 protein [Planctomycetes bacterium]|nr:glycosyltransferase family 4 protein [Planctomycetota bacterium]
MDLANPKLKITVLGTRGFPNVQGGIETHCENLYPRLNNGKCEVTVFTRKPYVDLKIDTYKGVRLVPLFCPKNKFLEAFLHSFLGVLAARKHSQDIMHIHGIGPSLVVPFARILGLKVIMTHHGPDYQRKKWGRLAKMVLKLGERSGCKWANDIITISGTISNHIKEKYKRDVTVIPNGVRMPDFLQSDSSIRKYGLTKGKYILSVGRFVPEKGFHDLINSFDRLSNKTWKLVIVGRADHEDKYSSDLQESAKRNMNIVLTGFLTGEPLEELYCHAGLFVLPSYYEGLPIVLLEALSYGLSCIASDIPANRNVELDEDRFFNAGNIKELVTKLNKFIIEPLTEEKRNKQRNLIADKYNWDKIADDTFEVYTKVMDG